MIYWFTGERHSGKTALATMLYQFLKNERRNWRKSVFHLDAITLHAINGSNDVKMEDMAYNTKYASEIAAFINYTDCDIVVSITSPSRNMREHLKTKFGSDFIEIYLNNNSDSPSDQMYEPPTNPQIEINTSRYSLDRSFSDLINKLNNSSKL